jgi:hypothetical protein
MAKPICGGCRERDARIAALERRDTDLAARLGQDRSNSSLQPIPVAIRAHVLDPGLTAALASVLGSSRLQARLALAPSTLSKYLLIPKRSTR